MEDVEFGDRRFRVRGTDRGIDLCSRWPRPRSAPTRRRPCAGRWPASATRRWTAPSVPYGSAVCEVRMESGARRTLQIVRYLEHGRRGPGRQPADHHGQTPRGSPRASARHAGSSPTTDRSPGRLRSATFMEFAGDCPARTCLRSFAAGISEVEVDVEPARAAGGGEERTAPALAAVGEHSSRRASPSSASSTSGSHSRSRSACRRPSTPPQQEKPSTSKQGTNSIRTIPILPAGRLPRPLAGVDQPRHARTTPMPTRTSRFPRIPLRARLVETHTLTHSVASSNYGVEILSNFEYDNVTEIQRAENLQ